MKVVGTAAPAAQYRGHPYFGIDFGKPRFSRNEVLDVQRIRAYFGKSKVYLKRLLERAQARGAVMEEDEEEEDDDDGADSGRLRKRRR